MPKATYTSTPTLYCCCAAAAAAAVLCTGPIDVVANSPLANAQGYVHIDKETMQHAKYPNVFAIGDCAAVPTSKTAAAAAAEFLVLRDNLDSLMRGGPADVAKYDGYASCPLVTKVSCFTAQ
jgi:sulfide:quinone oxidoreductase